MAPIPEARKRDPRVPANPVLYGFQSIARVAMSFWRASVRMRERRPPPAFCKNHILQLICRISVTHRQSSPTMVTLKSKTTQASICIRRANDGLPVAHVAWYT